MVFVNDLPEEVLVAMNDPHAVNLGIATSFAWWGPPTSSRWFHPGIDLIRRHIPVAVVVETLNTYDSSKKLRRSPLQVTSWAQFKAGTTKKRLYPVFGELLCYLAQTLGRKIYVTHVQGAGSPKSFLADRVFCYLPDGAEEIIFRAPDQ